MAWIGHCRCLLTVWFCMCTYSMHAFTVSPGPGISSQQQNSTNRSTHMVPDKDDQTPSMDFQKQHKSKQLWSSSVFVCNWLNHKNHKPTVTVFMCHGSNAVRGYLLLYTCMIKCHQKFASKCLIINYLHKTGFPALEQVMRNSNSPCVNPCSIRKTTWRTGALPRANVGKGMHLKTDDSAAHERSHDK